MRESALSTSGPFPPLRRLLGSSSVKTRIAPSRNEAHVPLRHSTSSSPTNPSGAR